MNKEAFDAFWYWINERHRIYLKKTEGLPKPWTKDPVLMDFKFCNVFRQLDTGTIWLTENFVKPHKDAGPLLFFNIAWYRIFNWTGTGEFLGWQESWETDYQTKRLQDRMDMGIQVFTSAHMTAGKAGESKVYTHCKAIGDIWDRKNHLHMEIKWTGYIEEAVKLLDEIPCIGGFLAYEIATDLRHTPILEHAKDKNTWTNFGPGSTRGIERIFGPQTKMGRLMKAVELLEMQDQYLEEHVPEMELRDIEHSLCEVDKYLRVKLGEGQMRKRYPGR